jgi:hypothetical protein
MRPGQNVTFRPELAALAFAYALEASQRGFIGLSVFPIFEVLLQASVYPVIPAEAFLKLYETKRTARSSYGRSDFEFDDGEYFCREHGWEEPIDDTERKMYRRFFDAETVATQRAIDILLRGQEKRIAGKVTDITKLPNGAVTKKWNDPNASPRDDVKAAIKLMRDTIGLVPSCLCLTWNDFQNVLVAPELKDYLKFTTPYLVDTFEGQKRVLAQYLNVGAVNVGNAIYDSAKKGQKLKPADIWPNGKATLCVTPTNALDLKEPSLGRTFLWTDDSPQNLTTESYREEQTRSDIIRCRQNTDECYVFEAAGYVLTGLQ